jgi:hypothetical protein
VIVTAPPHMHMHWDDAVSAGTPPIVTFAEPGIHGAVIIGMHGCGVSAPMAAAVAAATCGFDGVVHIPNVAMFVIWWSLIVAAGSGPPPAVTIAGTTTRAHGATPNEHMSCAPLTTNSPAIGASL